MYTLSGIYYDSAALDSVYYNFPLTSRDSEGRKVSIQRLIIDFEGVISIATSRFDISLGFSAHHALTDRLSAFANCEIYQYLATPLTLDYLFDFVTVCLCGEGIVEDYCQRTACPNLFIRHLHRGPLE